jgi:hypothetical protein
MTLYLKSLVLFYSFKFLLPTTARAASAKASAAKAAASATT